MWLSDNYGFWWREWDEERHACLIVLWYIDVIRRGRWHLLVFVHICPYCLSHCKRRKHIVTGLYCITLQASGSEPAAESCRYIVVGT